MTQHSQPPRRRDVLAGLSVGLSSLMAEAPARAQPARAIDFHNHHVGPPFTAGAGAHAPPALRARFEAVNRDLADEGALIGSIEAAGVTARVVNTPREFLAGALGPDAFQRCNDHLAGLAARHPGRIHALASVDAYGGDAGARELERAVRELGLRGVFVEAAQGDLLPDAPQARPTLAAAAALGVPVFLHPITDPNLRSRFGRTGQLGTMLNRATVNAAGIAALIETGTFEAVPGLKVVVTTLALGGLLVASGLDQGLNFTRATPAPARRHVYIDTMGLRPTLIRAAVELLGADHVLAGTDWPIFVEGDVPQRLAAACAAAGLTPAEHEMIAYGNAARLLRLAG